MGSFCGSSTQTSTSNQTSTPVNTAALQGIYNTVAGAAATPYTPFSGEMTAPVNAQQTAGINNINANAGAAQPYYNTAAGYAATSGNPLSQAAITSYMNPYTQSVINSTQANFNEGNGIQQQQVKGNAAKAGALGGDRQAVAQSETARQQQLTQAPVIAGLQQANYTQALQAAQADRSAAGNAAGTFGNLGTAAQSAGLQGAQAQINAGTLQQQTQQAQDQAAYQQYLQKQGYPYQSAAFLEQYGLPSALAQGTTSSGTQTSPGPSLFGQLLGGGLAVAGTAAKFAADGGRIDGYASGGSPYDFVNNAPGYIKGAPSYIPSGNAAGSTSLQAPALQFAKPQQTDMKAIQSGISGLGDFSKLRSSTPDYGQDSNINVGGYSMPQFGNHVGVGDYSMPTVGFNSGGLVEAIHGIHQAIKRSRGGAVGGAPFQSFARGGRAFADGGDTFDGRFSPSVDSPFSDMSRGHALGLISATHGGITAPPSIGGNDPVPPADQGVVNPGDPIRLDPAATQRWREGVDATNPVLATGAAGNDNGSPQGTAGPANPMRLPAAIAGPNQEEDDGPGPMSYGPGKIPGSPLPVAPQQDDATAQPSSTSWLNPFHLSDKGSSALIAAGLGMMASRSPNLGNAIGEGGLHGLKSYSDATQAEREAADKAITQKQSQTRIDMEAQRIAQSASQFAKTNALATRTQDEKGQLSEYQKAQIEHQKKLEDPEYVAKMADAKGGSGLSGAALDIKARQMIDGDYSGLTNIGRGAQAGKTLEKISNRAAEILSEEEGMSSADAAKHMSGKLQEFKAAGIGKNAESRTAATREANLNLILKATDAAIPAALEASEKLDRTGWVPLNKIIQKGQVITSNPELAEFGMANLQLAEHWARAMNPTGVMRESDRDKALEFLSTATGKDTYRRVVAQLQKQITRERDAIRGTREPAASSSATPGGAAPSESTIPVPPAGIPAGSSYSPSRKQWKAPDNQIYNADGSKA